MYCKHCGKEIADDSKFCNHCGKPQDNSNKSLTNKPVWVVYFIWALANLYLLMGKKNEYCAKLFYPFTNDDYYCDYSWIKDFYDFSEFIVYVFIIPAILYVVYRRYKRQIDKFVKWLLNSR